MNTLSVMHASKIFISWYNWTSNLISSNEFANTELTLFGNTFGFHGRFTISGNWVLSSFNWQRYFHFDVSNSWSEYELAIISGVKLFANFDFHIYGKFSKFICLKKHLNILFKIAIKQA